MALGHHLEQRRLHLRRRPVDLVGEDEVGEHRAELDVERARSTVGSTCGADDVGRHEVGRELDARANVPPTTRRQRLDRERLGEAGHAFEQAVAAGEQAHHHPLDHAVLADDDPLDLEQRALEDGGGLEWVEGVDVGLLVHGVLLESLAEGVHGFVGGGPGPVVAGTDVLELGIVERVLRLVAGGGRRRGVIGLRHERPVRCRRRIRTLAAMPTWITIVARSAARIRMTVRRRRRGVTGSGGGAAGGSHEP